MSNRYILKPEPLKLGDKPYTIDHFLLWLGKSDGVFAQNGAGLRARLRLEAAVANHADQPILALDEEAWRHVHVAAENPSGKAYPVEPAAALVPFLDAVRGAKPMPPAVVPPVAAAVASSEATKPKRKRKAG